MARIRTIKPEFCVSEQIAECSTNARLLFVTMWMFCDDAGRHPASVLRLKAECFPFDPFTKDEMTAYVRELHAAGLLVEFEWEGEKFWQVTGWKHQKIDRPNAKYGPISQENRGNSMVTVGGSIADLITDFGEPSTNDRRVFGEGSPPEGKGKEGKGKEGNGVGIDDESPKPSERPPLRPEKVGSKDKIDKQSSVQRSPPSVAEVRQYMANQGYPDDADAFVDHYTANGWVQGRGKPLKDWKAAVRNWQRNDFRGSSSSRAASGYEPPEVIAQQLREKYGNQAGQNSTSQKPAGLLDG